MGLRNPDLFDIGGRVNRMEMPNEIEDLQFSFIVDKNRVVL